MFDGAVISTSVSTWHSSFRCSRAPFSGSLAAVDGFPSQQSRNIQIAGQLHLCPAPVLLQETENCSSYVAYVCCKPDNTALAVILVFKLWAAAKTHLFEDACGRLSFLMGYLNTFTAVYSVFVTKNKLTQQLFSACSAKIVASNVLLMFVPEEQKKQERFIA